MAQPISLKNGPGSVPTLDRKGILAQSNKETIQSRISAYVDPDTRWIMTMRERDEFVSRCSASAGTFSSHSLFPESR